MKKVIHSVILTLISVSILNADVVICKGVKSIETINQKLQQQKDASALTIQLNTTDTQAVMILNNEYYKFNFASKLQHPGGFMMDAYNDGVSEEIFYSKENKVATLKSSENGNELIITFSCQNKFPQ